MNLIEKIQTALFYLMLCFMAFFWFCSRQADELRQKVPFGELYCFVDDADYCSDLTDFCVKEENMYVLYENKGVLKVYDLNGAYERSYAFRTSKGTGALFTDQSYVYLQDQALNFYVFSAGENVDVIAYNDYSSYLQKIGSFASQEDQRKTEDGIVYVQKGASLYRIMPDSNRELVVDRPVYTLLVQGLTPFAVIGLFMSAIFALLLYGKFRGKSGKKLIFEEETDGTDFSQGGKE